MRIMGSLLLGLIFLIEAALPAAARPAPAVTDGEIAQVCGGNSLTGKLMLPDRMPAIPPEKYDKAQKKAEEQFFAARGRAIWGPWTAIMRSPEIVLRGRPLGDYLRNKTILPPEIREFVIVLTARQWTQEYEWHDHCPIALRAGLSPEIIREVAEGRRPDGMSSDERIVYGLLDEVFHNRSVSDATYAKAVARFGEQGVLEIVAVNGYFAFIAAIANVARTALPAGSTPGLPPMPR